MQVRISFGEVIKHEINMIPTSYKAKLSCKLSWPLGAERISKEMESVPQLASFILSFYGHDQNAVLKSKEVRVIEIEYSFAKAISESMIRLGYGVPKWHIHIYPVPRELKSRISQLLEPMCSQLREWCLARSKLTGNEGREGITILHDAENDELRCEQYSSMGPAISRSKVPNPEVEPTRTPEGGRGSP